MVLLFVTLFIAAIIQMVKYLILFSINFLSDTPTKVTLKYSDEIILVASVSYFIAYILQ
jgi:hypothetical protein